MLTVRENLVADKEVLLKKDREKEKETQREVVDVDTNEVFIMSWNSSEVERKVRKRKAKNQLERKEKLKKEREKVAKRKKDGKIFSYFSK